jgi:predicted nucleic acid-binding protein
MKMKVELDLTEITGCGGESVASTIADEVLGQIKNKVRRELKNDKRVDELVKRLSNAAVEKMLASMEE